MIRLRSPEKDAVLRLLDAERASPTVGLARDILGNGIFGLEEWATHYPTLFAQLRLERVPHFPWGEEILTSPCPFMARKVVSQTHFAFLGLQAYGCKLLTLRQWMAIHPLGFDPASFSWAMRKPLVMKETCKPVWYLMPIEIVRQPMLETYDERVVGLPCNYEVPLVIEEVSKRLLYLKACNSVPTMPWHLKAWCRDQFTPYHRVCISVGIVDTGAITLEMWFTQGKQYSVGLAASRKTS